MIRYSSGLLRNISSSSKVGSCCLKNVSIGSFELLKLLYLPYVCDIYQAHAVVLMRGGRGRRIGVTVGGRRHSTLTDSAGRIEIAASDSCVSRRPVAYWLFGMGGLVAGMVLVGRQ